jgi:3-isopropylmalate dehydratase small subunit
VITSGRSWVFSDDIAFDGEMMPVRFQKSDTLDPSKLVPYLMTGLDPDFPNKIHSGDTIVAGEAFGSGNFHPHALLAMKHAGVYVVAESVTRGFYRMAVAVGLWFIPFCPGVTLLAKDGGAMSVNYLTGEVKTENGSARYEPLPDIPREIIEAGSEEQYVINKLKEEESQKEPVHD